MDYRYEDVARMIDHALLSPSLRAEEMDRGCRLAVDYGVASVCIVPYYLGRCAAILAGSGVKASTVIGFPLGGQATAVKRAEAIQALTDGGEELDMVINISAALGGDWAYVRDDIRAVIEPTHGVGRKLKVIFENCYLDDAQKVALSELCGELGADWIKTSTGFGPGGATLDDLRLMRAHAPASVQVKASGGIRDLDTVLAMRAVGVSRVGASGTRAILDECRARLAADL